MNVTPKLKKLNRNFIEEYLEACGIEDVKEYLNPTLRCLDSPTLYYNIDEVCRIVHDNITKRIGILNDTDVDGLCSSAILYLFLKELGNNPTLIFHTSPKAHGINSGNGEDKVKENLPEMELLMIPDASIDQEMATALKQNGVTICELDHHDTALRNHVVTVNCQYQDNTNHYACGTLVTYKFIQRYCELYDIYLPDYSDYVALATVADVMDMRELENRYYVYTFCQHYGKENFINFLNTKLNKGDVPTPKSIGWKIAPLLNAVFRSGSQQDIKDMFFAMVGEKDASTVYKQLTKVKREQDKAVKEVYEAIRSELDQNHKVLFAQIDNKDKSFGGLIANKILGAYNKPSFVLREINPATWTGSYRSNIPLKTAINESGLAEVSGHEAAAGIVIKKANFERFKDWLETLDLSIEPDIEVAAEVNPKEINLSLCGKIEENNSIWGTEVPSPSFYICTKLTKDNVSIFKKSSTTIKVQKDGASFLMFFAKESDVEAFTENDSFEIEMVVGDCSVNEYMGDCTPQAVIQKYEIHKKTTEKRWEDLF